MTKISLFALMMDMEMLESGEQMVHYQGEVVVEQKNDEMVGCYETKTSLFARETLDEIFDNDGVSDSDDVYEEIGWKKSSKCVVMIDY